MSRKPAHKHKFNDDLLLGQSDRAQAEAIYPGILHVLHHPELQQLFTKYDVPANKAKRQGRQLGLASIILVSFALVLSSIEPYFLTGESGMSLDRHWHIAIALISASAGLIGTFIGSIGILHSHRKRAWLLQRLMTERLRQFHFQMLICRLGDIHSSLSGAHGRQEFLEKRKKWLKSFEARFIGKLDSEFERALQEDNEGEIWLHPKPPSAHQQTPELEPVFAAYRELRIVHQLGYADHKLSRANPKGLRSQRDMLSMASLISTALVCLIQACILLMVFFDGPVVNGLNKSLAITSMIIVFVTLAARAFEQGMQPDREIERYQQYRASVRAILDRFDEPGSLQAEKISVMMDMERLSFDEMHNFLLTNNEARFVM